VSGLRDWLQGYAVEAGGKRFAASPGHDSVVTSDGWRLHFVEWQNGPSGRPMPRRIDVARARRDAETAATQVREAERAVAAARARVPDSSGT